MTERTVSVTMLRPVNRPSAGGQWNPGERAGFPPAIADDLLRRGLVRLDAPAAALDAPAVDRMMRMAPRKK